MNNILYENKKLMKEEKLDEQRKTDNKYKKNNKYIFKIIFPLTLIICSICEKFFKYQYIKTKFNYVLDDIPNYDHTHKTNNTIFWCWFQGEEYAPKLYSSGLNSIRMNLKNFNIITINDNNIENYVHFPSYIMKKYNDKKITRTHFSDLLRLELLIKYGGTWIDASVLISNYTESYFNKDLFFFRERTFEAVGSSWFLTSEKESPILKITRDLLYEYWRINDYLYEYFLFHMFLKMTCYFRSDDFKSLPYISNRPPHQLRNVLNHKFSQNLYNKIISSITVHKLSIKGVRVNKKKAGTIYHHIIEKYLPK